MDSAATLLFNIKANPDEAVENIARFRSLFSTDISQLGTQLDSWSKEVFGEFESIKGAMLGLGAAAAGAAVMIGAALFELAKKTAEQGEQFELLHQQTGIAVSTLSGMKVIAGETGVAFDTLVRGVEIMDRGLSPFASSGATAAKAMKSLGVSATDAHGHLRDNTDLLADLADKFSHMKDGADKTAAAMSIFGRSGADMIPILDKGGAAIRTANEHAKAMGMTFTDLSAHQSVEFLESFRDIKYTIEGLGVSIGQKVLPAITSAMQGAADFLVSHAMLMATTLRAVGELLTPVFVALKFSLDLVVGLGAVLADDLEALGRIALGVGDLLLDFGKETLGALVGWFHSAKSAVEGWWNSLGDTKMMQMVSAAWDLLFGGLKIAIGETWLAIQKIIGAVEWVGREIAAVWDRFIAKHKDAAAQFHQATADMKQSAGDFLSSFHSAPETADALKDLGKMFDSLQMPAASAAASADKLATSLASVKQALESLRDGAAKPVAAINAQFDRAVAAADAQLAADRKLAAAHKLSLADLSQREKEYHELVLDLAQERNLKLQQAEKDRAAKVARLDQDLETKLAGTGARSLAARLAAINKEISAERAKYEAEDALDAAHEQMLAQLRAKLTTEALQAIDAQNAAEQKKFQGKYEQLLQTANQYYNQSLKGADKIKFEQEQEITRLEKMRDAAMALAKTDQDRARVAQAAEYAISAARAKETADLNQLAMRNSRFVQEWRQDYALIGQALNAFGSQWAAFGKSFLTGIAQQISAQQKLAAETGKAQFSASAAVVGALKQSAIVQAIYNTAKSIEAFASMDFAAGTQYALAAATYGIVAGEQIASLMGGGGGSSRGSARASTSSPASSSQSSSSSSSSGSNQQPQTIINMHISGMLSSDSVQQFVGLLNGMTSSGQIHVIASRALRGSAVVPV